MTAPETTPKLSVPVPGLAVTEENRRHLEDKAQLAAKMAERLGVLDAQAPEPVLIFDPRF